MDEISIIRLVSGEEIIAALSISNGFLNLKKPAVVIIQTEPNGKSSIGLVDYLMLAEKKEIFISSKDVLCTYTPNANIKNAYNSMFGSDLVVANPVGNILPFSK